MNDVTHRSLPQHLFSSSVGITRHMPHTHQLGLPSGTGGTPALPPPHFTKFLA